MLSFQCRWFVVRCYTALPVVVHFLIQISLAAACTYPSRHGLIRRLTSMAGPVAWHGAGGGPRMADSEDLQHRLLTELRCTESKDRGVCPFSKLAEVSSASQLEALSTDGCASLALLLLLTAAITYNRSLLPLESCPSSEPLPPSSRHVHRTVSRSRVRSLARSVSGSSSSLRRCNTRLLFTL